ncbi:class I fructose-bisphosphate aldolase [Murdochiella vaginalis]|uniref:class I fructose-bisphosphate aldolase n=1 Tax=Murdochiella vaginalis TaxID=1852373 RepID=UPI0008FE8418|nr:fructose-bisphosphate aldolase [Murdochiella vaginalis]
MGNEALALGKRVRLSRMVNPESNKMMAITVDHAISRGIAQLTGIHDIQGTIDKIVAGHPDAITMTGGIQKRCWGKHAGSGISILHKISNYAPTSPTNDIVFGSVNAAIRMGADAVSLGAMTLGDFQNEQFKEIGEISEVCDVLGMPLIGHIYPKGESVPADKRTAWENIAYCVRSACELGLDVIKTTYTGDPESMAKVISVVPSSFRVVIQGGDPPAELTGEKRLEYYLTMTREALDSGVGGVTMGRWVWEYQDVTALVIALRRLIHKNYSVKETMELLKQVEHDKNYEDYQSLT